MSKKNLHSAETAPLLKTTRTNTDDEALDDAPLHLSHNGLMRARRLISPVTGPDSVNTTINHEEEPDEETARIIARSVWSMVCFPINPHVLTVLLQSLGFTIVLPSLWFYLKSEGGSENFLGWVVAAYSLGGFLGSPIFGYWSNLRTAREPLVVSLILSIIGNVWYSMIYLLPWKPWQFFASRFVVGFASGAFSVCRAYVSHATTLKDRRAATARTSAAQGVGFVLGPAVGTLLALGHFDIKLGVLHIDDFTLTGWFSALVNFSNIFVIYWLFVEVPHEEEDPNKKKMALDKKEFLAFTVCIFIFMVIIANFAVFETMLTVYTETYFNWGTLQNGVLLAVAGLISIVVFVFISMPFLEKYAPDRPLMLSGLVILTVSLLMLAEWPFLRPPKIDVHSPQQPLYVPYWQFYLAALLQSLGYPIASALLGTISSKVIHPKNQGAKMGWMNSAGYAARMVGPIWASDLAWRFGGTPRNTDIRADLSLGSLLLFVGTALLVALSVVVTLVFYVDLTPHPENRHGKAAFSASQVNAAAHTKHTSINA